MIKDSGNRRKFETGAVRDMQEGKGRPTLMPLEVASWVMYPDVTGDDILTSIARFREDNDTTHLYNALRIFGLTTYGYLETMLLEVSIHFEEGAKKYGENNWQKGLPVDCYLDSAIRHYLKHRRGDTDEHHDRAFCWNIMCCIWEVDHHEH